MNLAQLQAIIKHAGGASLALDYASDLLVKVNRVAAHQVPANYLKQFAQSREAGDLRGRLLEINLIDYFSAKNVPLQYEVKQGSVSGDVDLLWQTNGVNVYIEVKLLGQDQVTKQKINEQLQAYGVSASSIEDDTYDVMRLQYTIIDKATLKKFEYPPVKNNINLIAIDVSELQLGAVDAADCVLATLGTEEVVKHFGLSCSRSHVVGLFETASKSEQHDWMSLLETKIATNPHPRDYIHGVIFLFREPKELAALSYDLKGCIAWNTRLINGQLIKKINADFHKIIPFGW